MKLNKATSLILTIFACFMWSTAFVGIKIGYRYMSAPFNFAGMRFFLAGLMLIPFCLRKSFYEEIRENKRLIIFVTLFQTFIGYALYYYAMSLIDGAIASIIIGAGPLITAILSHFLMDNDKLSLKKSLTLNMGMSGIVIIMISTKPTGVVGLLELLGIILLLFNSTLGALVNIKIAKDKKNINPIFLSSIQMILGGILLMGLGFMVEGRHSLNLPMEFYLSLIWLALISAVATSIWYILLRQENIKVSELNMWKFLIPLSGALLSWIILPEESPSFSSILGMFLILTSLILYYKKN